MKSKKIIFSVIAIAFVSVMVVIIYSTNKGSDQKEIIVTNSDNNADVTKLKTVARHSSFLVDPDDKEKLVGFADYVFVAKVISNNKTIHRDVDEIESENGKTKVSTPYTQYTIEVIDNIKGKLKKNKPFEILKDGGVTLDKKYIEVDENDELPLENNYYIFIGFAQEDNSVLISGPNSNILLNANNKQEIVSSEEYKAYKKAVKNEVKYERERFQSYFEE